MVNGVKNNSTEPQLGDALQHIQTQYGAGPQKPREIKKTLGKDDFLRIMITQMKHQDPTQPFKAEQFASELAQYSSVEQLQNINQGLSKLSNQNQPMERLAMTNLIGKTVTVDRERFPHVEGKQDFLTFVLPQNASETKLKIISEAGEPIFEKDLGPTKGGSNSFSWDGIKSNTVQAKSGNYLFRIEARGEGGQLLQVNPQSRAKVMGVSFEGTEPVFLVGDPSKPDKVLMKNIIQIETDSAPQQTFSQKSVEPSQAKAEDEAPPAPSKANNFISFKKGVGSSNLDLNTAAPDVRNVINQYQNSEKGFPNGLRDPDEINEKGGE